MKSFIKLLSEIALTNKGAYVFGVPRPETQVEPKPMSSDELHTHIMNFFDEHNIPNHKKALFVAHIHHEVESGVTPIHEISKRVAFYASGQAGI